jgi:hypothetical protein
VTVDTRIGTVDGGNSTRVGPLTPLAVRLVLKPRPLVFGMFALMAEYEAALIRERTQAGLAAARVGGNPR